MDGRIITSRTRAAGKQQQQRRRPKAAAAATSLGGLVVLCVVLHAGATAAAAAAIAPSQCAAAAPCSLACAEASGRSCARAAARSSSPSADVVTEAGAARTMADVVAAVTAAAEAKASAAVAQFEPGSFPAATRPGSGAWETVQAGHWVSGFFPGVLWQLHNLTGKATWAAKAKAWQAPLADRQRDWQLQHDFGFVYMPSFAHGYEVTKDPEDLRQALLAAQALAWAYNPATRSLRTFEGWRPPGATNQFQQIVIIDFMMNIEVLTWAAQHAGDDPDAFRHHFDRTPQKDWVDIAVNHARQVAANHVRPDGSTFHIVEYNPVTGEINKKYTYQGHAAESTWARGQAWAIAGFSQMHAATGLPEFLDTAKKVADRWLQLLSESPQRGGAAAEFVPRWDFSAPHRAQTDGPRDSSAAAVAALGLLHLAEALEGTDCGRRYLCAAVSTLRALSGPKYLSGAAAGDASGHAALLKHATGNLPAGVQEDVGLIYGDYYFLKALAKCRGMAACATYPAA